ncbi:MAG TPA: glycosyltransferase family 4 protein, partial [Candidatus Bathyarchaeia archaeon]|nr:glycosyltransferase family 4 protein [Candidatus Bathyarchaeia archaeon]
MSERRVLVISWDRIGEMMAGSAIRALEMARALVAPDTEVTLAAPEGSSDQGAGGVRLAVYPRESSLGGLIERADVVVLSGRVELMSAVKKPLVVDLYDPFIFSNLELYGRAFNRSSGRPLLALRWLQHHLAHGDFFLCASTVQRSFWLGMLAAAGRLNRANYEQDPELANLLAVVPFGISDEPPVAGAPVLKGVVPGIGTDDHVVLWAGGMWNWVDPITLVRATGLVRARRRDVKTVILGARHPNPEIGEMTVAREARALAAELGLLDDGVWFIDWVAYRERQRYVLESDVGVSLHGPGVESEFAFRTRVLDYLWCLRPMVVTTGDELAARVEREDLGRVVPPEDAPAVASAIEALLDASPAEKEAREARLATARASLGWSKVIEPLRRFCAAARHAPDHSGEAWFSADPEAGPSIRKEDALIAEEFISSARAISSALGEDYAPRQRFVATYDNLCQIDVLFWVEPPVSSNLVFELGATGSDLPVARVVVPAAQLPHCDWQRFEFRPILASRGREFELRLKLLPSSERLVDDVTSPAPDTGAAPAAASAGRVCVWRCAPRQEPALAGDNVAFIARYLVSGLIELVPAAPESFLFLHNTTL